MSGRFEEYDAEHLRGLAFDAENMARRVRYAVEAHQTDCDEPPVWLPLARTMAELAEGLLRTIGSAAAVEVGHDPADPFGPGSTQAAFGQFIEDLAALGVKV